MAGRGRVVVAGGAGFVGRALVSSLLEEGFEPMVLSRRHGRVLPEGVGLASWEDLAVALEGAAGLVNLAGEGIADRRWTTARKALLRESRLRPTQMLMDGLKGCSHPPPVLIQASAVGFYGARDEHPLDESESCGQGFLAELCRDWEAEADRAEALGLRVVKLRLGVVLGSGGGAFPRLAAPVKAFLGTTLGDGHQGFSWIHLADLVNLVLKGLADRAWSGPYNATAPDSVSNGAFTRSLADRLHRPVWPMPPFLSRALLRLALGEMAQAMLLSGAHVRPRRALEQGFVFRFPTVNQALVDLLRR